MGWIFADFAFSGVLFIYLSRDIIKLRLVDMFALSMVSSHCRVLMFLKLLRATRNTWAVSKPHRFSNVYPPVMVFLYNF